MIRLLRTVHDHAQMKVKIHGGCSSGYLPERGLREGFPSSPVLFSIYHDAVMQDFRARRAQEATANEEVPGLEWEYSIDGKLVKNHIVRHQAGQETRAEISHWGFWVC